MAIRDTECVPKASRELNEYIPPTVREQLLKLKAEFERKTAEIDSALKTMDENPGFEKVHDAITKLGLGLR